MHIDSCFIEDKIDNDATQCFYRMLDPFGSRYANDYISEEKNALENFLLNNVFTRDMSFVAIGAGELLYLRTALKYTKEYIAIEPLSDIFINDSVKFLLENTNTTKVINKPFEEVNRDDIGNVSTIFFFLFNVIAYINDPIKHINDIIQPGDVICISQWNTTNKQAKKSRKKYMKYINQNINLNHLKTVELQNLTSCMYNNISYFDHMEHHIKSSVDIRIIYTA